MTRSILVNLAKYGLGIGVLAWVIWRGWADGPNGTPGLGKVLTGQQPVQFVPLLCAVGVFVASLLLSFVRWYILVRAQDLPFTLGNAFRLGLIGYFWSTFFPGSVGGDAVKAFYLAREQSRRTVAVATVLLDRALALWALIWFVALLGVGFWILRDPALEKEAPLAVLGQGATLWEGARDFFRTAPLKSLILGALVLVGITSGMWVVLLILPPRRAEKFAGRLSRIPKVGTAASEFWRAIWMYRSRQGTVLLVLLMAMVGHVGWVCAFYFSAQVFQAPGCVGRDIPSLTEHFLIVPVGMTVQALFPAPGGVGGGEYGFGRLYDLVGKPDVNGVLGSLASRFITLGLALIGAIVYLRLPKEAASQKEVETGKKELLPAAGSANGANGAGVMLGKPAPSMPGEA